MPGGRTGWRERRGEHECDVIGDGQKGSTEAVDTPRVAAAAAAAAA